MVQISTPMLRNAGTVLRADCDPGRGLRRIARSQAAGQETDG
jgi:hypothetical protein